MRLQRRRERRRLRGQTTRRLRGLIRADLWASGVREPEQPPDDAPVVTYEWPEAKGAVYPFWSETATIKCPENFSLIDNPERTIRMLNRMVAAMRRPAVTELHIDQSGVKKMDLCASAVMGVLFKSGRGKVGKCHHHMPADPEVADLVRAAGLGPILGIPPQKSSNVLFYKLVEGMRRSGKATGSTSKEIEGTLIVDYLDECFRKYRSKLNDDAKQYLSDLITEALTNSEEHSGSDGWWMAAYLHQGAEYGDCHLTLFNLGRTIAESMQVDTVSEEIKESCLDVLKVLRRRLGFGRRYTEEGFWTVAALQPGVTSKPDSAIVNKDRGTGSVRIIERFLEIGVSPRAPDPPVMVILSGNTMVRLDGTHRIEDVVIAEGRTGPRIAFNKAKDLRQPPDPKYVRHMKERFPGTLISCRFYMDEEHLSSLKNHVEPIAGPH